MSSAHDIWQKKEGPLWLLHASRALAQYPSAENINNERVNDYVEQFSYSKLPEITDLNYLDKIHPGHKQLLSYFASEALAYYGVFYERNGPSLDLYTQELVGQYNKAFGPEREILLKDYQIHEEPNVICNMAVAVAIGAIRDMALVEDLYRRHLLDVTEHQFALDEINDRMSRIGINGIDKMLDARPELDDFLRHDVREINVGHIPGKSKHATMTRAACYNVGSMHLENFRTGKEALTEIRQQIIGKDFCDLEARKDRFILMHTVDAAEPSAETRQKLEGYGAAAGHSSTSTENKHTNLLKKISSDLDRRSFESFNEYYNFLIYDGIAINHPKRDQYADTIRTMIREKDLGQKANIINPGEQVEGAHEDYDKTQAPEVEPDQSLLPAVIQSEPPQNNNASAVEDADVVEMTPSPTHNKSEVIEVEAESEESAHSNAPTHESVYDKQKQDKHSANTGAKIAAIAAGAGLATLLASGNDTRDNPEDKNDRHRTNNHSDSKLGKKLAIAVAATVTLGGVILLTRKPDSLHKPLKELTDKLMGRTGGI